MAGEENERGGKKLKATQLYTPEVGLQKDLTINNSNRESNKEGAALIQINLVCA